MLVYSGRHKSASTWARNILHEVGAALDLDIMTIVAPSQWAEAGSLGEMVAQRKPDLLVLTNVQLRDFETLPPSRAINVVRDPRDIVISGYFSHRNSHPEVAQGVVWHELVEHRKRLKKLDEHDGILEEIEFSGYFIDHMVTWDYDRPDILELRMEDMISDQVGAWERVFQHYGLLAAPGRLRELVNSAAVKWNLAARRQDSPMLAKARKHLPRLPLRRVPRSYIPMGLARYNFTRLSKSDRKPGEVDENSHYRKGVPGDWRNYFTERHMKAFRERYGDLVERLGYDPS